MLSTIRLSPSKSKFPPTVISNTLVISFNVLMRWWGFQIQTFWEDYPSVPKKIFVGLAICLLFAQKRRSIASWEESENTSSCKHSTALLQKAENPHSIYITPQNFNVQANKLSLSLRHSTVQLMHTTDYKLYNHPSLCSLTTIIG